jgi:CBS domain-containing protein
MTASRPEMTPPLLRRLPGAPVEIARALATAHEADVAEALSRVEPAAAAEVLSALPFEFAVRVLEHLEFERRHEVFRHFATDTGVALIRAMAPDQQAHLFRELPEADRTRFLEELDAGTRSTLALLLAYPPTTAGGIMTTDYVSIPPTWTVAEALSHIAQVGRRKPVYAIYVLDPDDHRLVHVVSLRELVVTDRTVQVMHIGEHRGILKVSPMTDREEVARLLSKYNLLAVPVVDEHGHLLGTITVDDVIDAIVKLPTIPVPIRAWYPRRFTSQSPEVVTPGSRAITLAPAPTIAAKTNARILKDQPNIIRRAANAKHAMPPRKTLAQNDAFALYSSKYLSQASYSS